MLTVERRAPTAAELTVEVPAIPSSRAPKVWLLVEIAVAVVAWWAGYVLVVMVAGIAFAVTAAALVGNAGSGGYQRTRDVREVEVIRVSGARWAQMEMLGDEGPHHFAQVAPRQLLYLRGHWMYDSQVMNVEQATGWPSEFELVWAPESDEVIRMTTRGPEAPLARTYEYDELFGDDVCPLDGSVVLFDGDLDDLPSALAAASRRALSDRS